jgi:GT2 family glycosyltransferase
VTSGSIAYKHRGFIDFRKVFPYLQTPLPISSYQQKVVEIDMASFVGLLINRHSITKIGLPRKEFFIYHDDAEYCIRLRQIGKIFLITDSIIFHKSEFEKSRTKVDFQGMKFLMTPYDKLWLEYFERRNLVWLGMMYGKNRLVFYLDILIYYFRSLLKIILFADFKLKRASALTKSYRDGLRGIFDNSKPKQILYDKNHYL